VIGDKTVIVPVDESVNVPLTNDPTEFFSLGLGPERSFFAATQTYRLFQRKASELLMQ
jgi:hypothetical protein